MGLDTIPSCVSPLSQPGFSAENADRDRGVGPHHQARVLEHQEKIRQAVETGRLRSDSSGEQKLIAAEAHSIDIPNQANEFVCLTLCAGQPNGSAGR